ncbi:MAG: DUF5808 domain-containing protein [Chloroflexi bacterium]|nr:DUF5808 domain-containing protein [Chloroflexota bacterium]
MKKLLKKLRKLVVVTLIVLLVGAVIRELSKPPEQRTWHGLILGVPYDFRPPTLERVKEVYWNPNDKRLFPGRVFGLGWGINFAALYEKVARSGQ